MEARHLIWTEESRTEQFRTRLFSVRETVCRSPEGKTAEFTVIDTLDWVIVIPVLEAADSGNPLLAMVRQWRHGTRELSLEFPGGVIEAGESDRVGAVRELEEETALRAGKLVKLGDMAPNPAIMSNRIHFYAAFDLSPLPSQHLDEDEFLDVETVSLEEVRRNMGKPPFVHALTAAALALYLGSR